MTDRQNLAAPAAAVCVLLTAMIVIYMVILAVVLVGNEESQKKNPPSMVSMSHLLIDDVYFMVAGESECEMRITVYMTNDGTEDARNVRAHVWPVIEGRNLATDKEEIKFGDIRINQTMVSENRITLEDGSLHSVEILVFESEKLILKGKATISTGSAEKIRYSDVDVRGTSVDSDYDGMSDAWEEYYGLDPNDPSDAFRDSDGDGISNIDEYRENGVPVSFEDEGNILAGLIAPEGDNGAPFAIGAVLFLVLAAGVMIGLGAITLFSRRKREKQMFFKDHDNDSVKKEDIKIETMKGHQDDEIEGDLPVERGIYE